MCGVSSVPGLSIPEFVDGNNYKFFFGGTDSLVKSLDGCTSSVPGFSDRPITLFQGLDGSSLGGNYFPMFE